MSTGKQAGRAKRWAKLALLGSVWLLARRASAQAAACGERGDEPWLAVTFQGNFSASLERAAFNQLASGLARQGLWACTPAARRDPPLATLSLSRSGPAQATVAISVEDRLTQKQVLRVVRLEGPNDDEQALAIAVSAEELVRATWAELALAPEATAPARAQPAAPPPPPRAVVQFVGLEPVKNQAERGVFARAGIEYFARQHLAWGRATFGFQQAIGPGRLRGGLSLDGSLPQALPGGKARLFGLGANAAFDVWLVRLPRLQLTTGPALTAGWVGAVVEPLPGYRAKSTQTFVLRPNWSSALELRAGGTWLGVELSLGTTVHGLELRSLDAPATGVAGYSLGAATTWGASW